MISSTGLLLWSAICWVLVIPAAILNGLLREAVLIPRLGRPLGQPLSGVLLGLVIAASAALLVWRTGPQSSGTWLVVGAAWLLATVVFELLMVWMSGGGWAAIRAQYSFTDNDIWPLLVLWTGLAPLCMAALRSGQSAS
ncbi:MAG: hypothetical protein ACOCXJ_06355 [Planctomycetota bacterium]